MKDFMFSRVEHVERVDLGRCPRPRKSSTCLYTFYTAKNLLAIAFAALCSAAANALPLEWRADWPDCKPVEKLVHRGTDVELRPIWYVNGAMQATSNWTYSVYVQTNSQAAGEWFGPIPGTVFSHTNDVGAAMYQVMLRAETPGGEVNYTAFARLRMLDSPGYTPGELPLPAKTIDFADVVAVNAPWLLPDATNELGSIRVELGSVGAVVATNAADIATLNAATATNAADIAILTNTTATLSDSISTLSDTIETNYYTRGETDAKIVELAPAPGNYAAVSNAAMNARAKTDFAVGNGWVLTLPSGEQVWLEKDTSTTDYWASTGEHSGEYALVCFGDSFQIEHPVGNQFGDLIYAPSDATSLTYADGNATYRLVRGSRLALDTEITSATNYTDTSLAFFASTGTVANAASADTLYDSTHTSSYTADDFATTDELSATTSLISALADEVDAVSNMAGRVYSFMNGATNANFVVTNYQLTAETDAGRTHFDPSDPDLDFSTVPASLRLEDASSGTNRVVCDTRNWTVWYFACKIGGAINTAFTNAVATCRAWCGFTATGLENPVPDTLVVDVPNIWLMAGKTFEKHIAGTNSMWVIRSKDMVVPISDNSSVTNFLELTDAFGTPYIRFNKTESYFIDPATDGIEYDSATGAWLISYGTQVKPKGGANAVIQGSTMYPGKAILKDEDDPDCPATITWTGSAGAWVMNAVPKSVGGVVPDKMFFAAVVEVEGQDYIEYLRPMSIPHLLVNGVKIAPVVNGSTVTWQVVP